MVGLGSNQAYIHLLLLLPTIQMNDSQVFELQSLGRIVTSIKAYRQQNPNDHTDKKLDSFLKDTLSKGDLLFWQKLQQPPVKRPLFE